MSAPATRHLALLFLTLGIYEGHCVPSYVQCPSRDPMEYSIFFPNVCNCSEFYQCSNGVPYLHTCASQHWNPALNTCVLSGDSSCSDPTFQNSEPCDCNFEPNQNDCGFFYDFSSEDRMCSECPSGLHFNAELDMCDLPEHAGCPYKKNTNERKYTSRSIAFCPEGTTPTCSPDTSTYFPHPDDEHWYYECISGAAYCKICTPNKKWNQSEAKCE